MISEFRLSLYRELPENPHSGGPDGSRLLDWIRTRANDLSRARGASDTERTHRILPTTVGAGSYRVRASSLRAEPRQEGSQMFRQNVHLTLIIVGIVGLVSGGVAAQQPVIPSGSCGDGVLDPGEACDPSAVVCEGSGC